MKPARRKRRRGKISITLFLGADGSVTSAPGHDVAEEAPELARRLRRLVATCIENPTLVDDLAGLTAVAKWLTETPRP